MRYVSSNVRNSGQKVRIFVVYLRAIFTEIALQQILTQLAI
jgi:hypothetical protein